MKFFSLSYLKNFGLKIWLYQIISLILNKLNIFSNLKIKINNNKNKAILKYLENDFSLTIKKYQNDIMIDQKISNKIWVFWWQGLKNAPEIVQKCIASIKKYNKDKDIIIIDQKNLNNYYKLPNYIQKNLELGNITITHLSDIIRMNLLKQYGGFWIDATVLFTDNLFNNKKFNDFFTIKFIDNNEASISKGKWCGFFIGGNNPYFYSLMCDLFAEYWQKYNILIDYFLIDYFISISYKNNSKVRDLFDSVSPNNQYIFKLQSMLYKEYDEKKYNNLLKTNQVHKLSYKENGNANETSLYYNLFKK